MNLLKDVILLTFLLLLGTNFAIFVATHYGLPYVIGFGWGSLMFRLLMTNTKLDRHMEDTDAYLADLETKRLRESTEAAKKGNRREGDIK